MALLSWCGSDAYDTGDFSKWGGSGQQALPNRAFVMTPPAEVTGGPQSREFVGKYSIITGDGPAIGGDTFGRRCEELTVPIDLSPHLCQGGEIWMAWETYFGDPLVVANTNAFRARVGSAWNTITQLHSAPSWDAPLIAVDATAGSDPATWRFYSRTRGGTSTNKTSEQPFDLGPFSYGWHEFKYYIKFGQAGVGRWKCWIDGTEACNYTGPVGFSDQSCNYLKQGLYINGALSASSGALFDVAVFHTGMRMGTTEADVDAGGGGDPPPDPTESPATLTRDRRFGKTTVGAGRTGFSADNKRASKFATGLASDEEADVKDLHMWIEGMDGSASTQKVTLGVYADDGTDGEPGTKFGESDVEIDLAGTTTGGWVKVSPTTIRVTGENVWLAAGSGTPSNRLRYATDAVQGAMRFISDTYGSAPHLSDPFGAASTANAEVSICADYDVVAGSSGGGGDTTAPALVTAETPLVDGTSITLTYDEPLDTSSIPDEADYTVEVNGSAITVSSVTITGSIVELEISPIVFASDTITISYTQGVGREVKDIAGNKAVNLTDESVTNRTSGERVPSREITVVRSTAISRSSNPSARVAGLGGGGV